MLEAGSELTGGAWPEICNKCRNYFRLGAPLVNLPCPKHWEVGATTRKPVWRCAPHQTDQDATILAIGTSLIPDPEQRDEVIRENRQAIEELRDQREAARERRRRRRRGGRYEPEDDSEEEDENDDEFAGRCHVCEVNILAGMLDMVNHRRNRAPITPAQQRKRMNMCYSSLALITQKITSKFFS